MNWRLALVVTLVAAPGPVAIAWLALPLLVDPNGLPISIEALQIASAAQSIAMVVLAASAGALLSARVGLRAPALSAIACRGNVLSALRPQLLPGALGGLIGAAVIVGFYALAPGTLAALQAKEPIPLVARVLYGGITEEVLIRWGLMTFIVWASGRVLRQEIGAATSGVVWFSIGVSALLFGLAHVPSVAAAIGTVPLLIVAYVTVGNAMFGVVAGYLFWRYGLEAAITAHVLAHVIAYAIRG